MRDVEGPSCTENLGQFSLIFVLLVGRRCFRYADIIGMLCTGSHHVVITACMSFGAHRYLGNIKGRGVQALKGFMVDFWGFKQRRFLQKFNCAKYLGLRPPRLSKGNSFLSIRSIRNTLTNGGFNFSSSIHSSLELD